jgi:hypothetical protein
MTLRSALLAAAAAAAPFLAVPTASASHFDEGFDALASGTLTPFTDEGIAFSSPTDPGAFYVGNTGGLFSSLSGNALYASSITGSSLTITLPAPDNNISLTFAIGDLLGLGGSDTLSYATNTGATGSITAAVPAGYLFPEGTLAYTGPNFTSITLTSPTYQFAVDNIVATPEPASLGLLGLGVAGFAGLRRRRA